MSQAASRKPLDNSLAQPLNARLPDNICVRATQPLRAITVAGAFYFYTHRHNSTRTGTLLGATAEGGGRERWVNDEYERYERYERYEATVKRNYMKS